MDNTILTLRPGVNVLILYEQFISFKRSSAKLDKQRLPPAPGFGYSIHRIHAYRGGFLCFHFQPESGQNSVRTSL